MIQPSFYVVDASGDYVEGEAGTYIFDDRESAVESAKFCAHEYENVPYGVCLWVPGPGGFKEMRAVEVIDFGGDGEAMSVWSTAVYDDELATA